MSIMERIWGNTEFYQLITGYPGGIVIFGLRGEILEVNDVFANLLGCSESTLCEKKYFDICAAEYNAKEAEILKKQAFVDGYTELYPKKYELDGTSVLVNQHTYLVKDAADKPMAMLAMLCPVLPDSESETIKRELCQLEAENSRLKASLASISNTQVGTLQQNVKKLEAGLAEARETIADQEKAIIVKDKALSLKDKALEQMTAKEVALNQQLVEAQGALEVAIIAEKEKVEPEAPYLPAGPLPVDDDDDDDERPPDAPANTTDIHTADSQDENISTDDAPWEADAVIYDDEIGKATAANSSIESESETESDSDSETETESDGAERLETIEADPFADAPWEADDVVYDDDVVPPSDKEVAPK